MWPHPRDRRGGLAVRRRRRAGSPAHRAGPQRPDRARRGVRRGHLRRRRVVRVRGVDRCDAGAGVRAPPRRQPRPPAGSSLCARRRRTRRPAPTWRRCCALRRPLSAVWAPRRAPSTSMTSPAKRSTPPSGTGSAGHDRDSAFSAAAARGERRRKVDPPYPPPRIDTALYGPLSTSVFADPAGNSGFGPVSALRALLAAWSVRLTRRTGAPCGARRGRRAQNPALEASGRRILSWRPPGRSTGCERGSLAVPYRAAVAASMWTGGR